MCADATEKRPKKHTKVNTKRFYPRTNLSQPQLSMIWKPTKVGLAADRSSYSASMKHKIQTALCSLFHLTEHLALNAFDHRDILYIITCNCLAPSVLFHDWNHCQHSGAKLKLTKGRQNSAKLSTFLPFHRQRNCNSMHEVCHLFRCDWSMVYIIYSLPHHWISPQ